MQDYAKYTRKTKRPVTKEGGRRKWLWFLLVIALLIGVLYAVHLTQQPSAVPGQSMVESWVSNAKGWFARDKKPLASKKHHVTASREAAEEDIQFNFYTELPKMGVPVPQSTAEASKTGPAPQSTTEASKTRSAPQLLVTKPALPVNVERSQVKASAMAQTTSGQASYLLQIAAFKNKTAAGEMRVSLLLAGFEVLVIETMVANQPIYLLQQGPFSTLAQAKSIQEALKKKGIESVIKKVD